MKQNKEALKRLAEVEKKLYVEAKVSEWQKKSEEENVLLEMLEIHRKKQEIEDANLTPQERIAKHQREAQEVYEHVLEFMRSDPYYSKPKVWDPVRRGWCLPPEEEEWLDKHSELDSKHIEACRIWLASDERKQFEKEYAEFKKQRGEEAADDYMA